MCSRISLDSATAFLFNNDVCSLSAGLIYPPGTPEAANHDNLSSSNAFSRAFSDAQRQIAYRTFLGDVWPLTEMTGDVTKANMRVVNDFIEPLIAEALKKKRAASESDKKTSDTESDDPGHSCLLDHLVSVSDGKFTVHYLDRLTFTDSIHHRFEGHQR